MVKVYGGIDDLILYYIYIYIHHRINIAVPTGIYIYIYKYIWDLDKDMIYRFLIFWGWPFQNLIALLLKWFYFNKVQT